MLLKPPRAMRTRVPRQRSGHENRERRRFFDQGEQDEACERQDDPSRCAPPERGGSYRDRRRCDSDEEGRVPAEGVAVEEVVGEDGEGEAEGEEEGAAMGPGEGDGHGGVLLEE